MKVARRIITIDEERCDGCGQCVPACAEGAIEVAAGKARLVAEKFCDGLGACLGECPQDALHIIVRESDEFDEQAVEAHLKSQEEHSAPQEATMACGCPSSHIQSFATTEASCQKADEPAFSGSAVSALGHWPVQIRLIPPEAPFLKGADLLVAADCTPVAYPNFHRDFLQGKAVMVGCPKLDDVEPYVQKFAEIFSTASIRSVTVVVMEVPCCQGLPAIVQKGMEASGEEVPLEKVLVTRRGEILARQRMVA